MPVETRRVCFIVPGQVLGAIMVRALVVACAVAAAGPASAQESGALREIVSDYTAFSRTLDPVRAAQRGDEAASRIWPDNSPRAAQAREEALDALIARLTALEAQEMSFADSIERDALARRVTIMREVMEFDEERMPIISGEGFFMQPDYAATTTVIRNERDAENWIARLEAIPGYFATETANMRRGMRTGFVQPRLVAENALRSVRAQAALPDAESPLLAPFASMPETIPEATRTSLARRGAEVYARRVKPALQAFERFMAEEYVPRARTELGARALPDGEQYYRLAVRRHTTTDMTPEEVHALGQREVARVRAEMDAVMAETGFQGTFPEFLAFLRSDPQFFASDADELMRITSEIANRANGASPRMIGTLPRNAYAVTFIPSALEGGSSGYWPGNPLQGAPGQVLLRRTGAEQRTLYDLPAWVFHEGVPGHHTQIARAEELSDIPEYRRADDVTAYVEGWALYAERLSEEFDLYQTPYERFGRLSMEMWRACRLIIDTGVHWMGWSREEALRCLRENSALSEQQIQHEIDRYIGWPGQALAYKIGEIEIRDMRADATEALGACFDLRRFHDALLGAGPMPMAVLRRRIEAWVTVEREAGCAG